MLANQKGVPSVSLADASGWDRWIQARSASEWFDSVADFTFDVLMQNPITRRVGTDEYKPKAQASGSTVLLIYVRCIDAKSYDVSGWDRGDELRIATVG